MGAREVAPALTECKYEDELDHCTREGIVFVPYFPLRWLLRRSPVMLPIPGTLSLEHARENLAALDIELSDEEYGAL